jgi:hypothetical protein
MDKNCNELSRTAFWNARLVTPSSNMTLGGDALVYHPDQFATLDAILKNIATRRMQEIHSHPTAGSEKMGGRRI